MARAWWHPDGAVWRLPQPGDLRAWGQLSARAARWWAWRAEPVGAERDESGWRWIPDGAGGRRAGGPERDPAKRHESSGRWMPDGAAGRRRGRPERNRAKRHEPSWRIPDGAAGGRVRRSERIRRPERDESGLAAAGIPRGLPDGRVCGRRLSDGAAGAAGVQSHAGRFRDADGGGTSAAVWRGDSAEFWAEPLRRPVFLRRGARPLPR